VKNWFKQQFAGASRKDTRISEAEPTAPLNQERRRVFELLACVCSNQQSAIVDNTELCASWAGTFKRLEDLCVVLEVELNEVHALLDSGSFCTVSFRYNQHPHVFLTAVKGAQLVSEDCVELSLYLPDSIQATGRRDLFRVPVLRDLPFTALIYCGDNSFGATLEDINTGGARCVVEADHFSTLKVGDEIQLSLEFGDIRVTRAADVRYTDQRSNAIGVHFLLTEDPDERRCLRLIVQEAERFYLRRVNRLN